MKCKTIKGIPLDTKVWVFHITEWNKEAVIGEMTLGTALAHEHDWDDIYFDKQIAEERLKKFKERNERRT